MQSHKTDCSTGSSFISIVQALTTREGGNADIAGAIYLPPCPTHYGRRLATTPSADFCSITERLSPPGAIGSPSDLLSLVDGTPKSQGLFNQVPDWFLPIAR
jgi:hypothetical protein